MLAQLAANPPDPTNNVQVANYQKTIEAVKSLLMVIGASRQDTRDFMMKVSQLFLVSILFPIMTALLGYIFGTHQVSSTRRGGDQD